MRILIISNVYPPHYKGGYEIATKFIADGLSQKGHDVDVLTSRYGLRGLETDNRIHRLLYYFTMSGSKIGNVFRSARAALLGRMNYLIAKKIVERLKPDIVYAGHLSNISIFPIKAFQKYNIPVVYHIGSRFFVEHAKDCILEPNSMKRFYRKIVSGFDSFDSFDFSHMIAVSAALKKMHIEAGFPEYNISVIPPMGVSSRLIINKRKEPDLPKEKKIKLLYVGRLNKDKGVDIAILSVAYLINNLGIKDIVFDIIGSGDPYYLKHLQTLVNKSRLQESVRFKGQIAHEELLAQYRNYDIFVLPSFEEPFGIVLIEAMSQGLPVVATNTEGILDSITDGVNGFLVPSGDPVKMAEAVDRLIKSSSLRQQFIANGIQKVRDKFTNEIIIDKIEAYLCSCLPNGGI